jgi:hypothetical protein
VRVPALLAALALACSPAPPPARVVDATSPAVTPSVSSSSPTATAAWAAAPSAPLALTEVAAAVFADAVWVAGGLNAQGEAVADVQVFDGDRWQRGPPLPRPVHHAALVAAADDLYVVGGYEGSRFDTPSPAVWRLRQGAEVWARAPALPAPRAAGAAAWDGARIVYAGGVGPDRVTGDVFVFDGDTWTSGGTLSQTREHLAAASDEQGRVFVLGGRRGGLDTNVATVDLVEGNEVRPVGEVPTARGGVAAFWGGAAGACLVGGEGPAGTFAAVECIDGAGAVTVLPPLARARHGLGAAVLDGVAYALLGGPEPGLFVSPVVEALGL